MQRKPHGSASERRSGRRLSSFTACKCRLNKANVQPRMTASRATHIIVWSTSSVVTDLKKKEKNKKARGEREATLSWSARVYSRYRRHPSWQGKKVKSQRLSVSQSALSPTFGRPSCRHLCDVLFSNQMARSDDLESNRWPSCPTINVAVGQRCFRLRMNLAEIEQTDLLPDDLCTEPFVWVWCESTEMFAILLIGVKLWNSLTDDLKQCGCSHLKKLWDLTN